MMPSSWETLKESSFNWELCILVEISLEHPYKYSILLNKEISGGMTAVRRQSSSLLQKKKRKKIDNQFQHMIIDRPARRASWTRGRQVHPCLLVPVPPDSQRIAKLPDHVQAKDLLHKRCGGQGRLEWLVGSRVVTHKYVKFVSFKTTSGNETLMMLSPCNLQ
jgi:hypothetical protein